MGRFFLVFLVLFVGICTTVLLLLCLFHIYGTTSTLYWRKVHSFNLFRSVKESDFEEPPPNLRWRREEKRVEELDETDPMKRIEDDEIVTYDVPIKVNFRCKGHCIQSEWVTEDIKIAAQKVGIGVECEDLVLKEHFQMRYNNYPKHGSKKENRQMEIDGAEIAFRSVYMRKFCESSSEFDYYDPSDPTAPRRKVSLCHAGNEKGVNQVKNVRCRKAFLNLF